MLIYANIKVYEINKKWEDGFVSCITQFQNINPPSLPGQKINSD